jgi:type III secretion system low calcium response chaperone LcrH/SycD
VNVGTLDLSELYSTSYFFYESGHLDEAIHGFSLLAIQSTLDPKPWWGLGASLQLKGEYKKAIDAWRNAAFLDANNPYPHFHTAECFLSLKEKVEALDALHAAEKRNPPEELQQKIDLLKKIWQENKEPKARSS